MAKAGLIPGIETKQKRHAILFKIDLLSNDRAAAIRFLSDTATKLEKQSITISNRRNQFVASGFDAPTALIGFSARFFNGPLSEGRDEIKKASRFQISRALPRCLKQMKAKEDNRFTELGSQAKLAAKESDLIIILEHEGETVSEVVFPILEDAQGRGQVFVKSRYEGIFPDGGKSPLGVIDGIGNLQGLREKDPENYQKFIFIQESQESEPSYAGGTYLVFRKYGIDTEYWRSSRLRIRDNAGRLHDEDAARNLVIGRSQDNSLTIDRHSGKLLEPEYDEIQTIMAFNESHVRQSNPHGIGETNFGAEVYVKEARILRRSFSYIECSKDTTPKEGLLFLCFQSDIQRSGFEFIHNEWLMSKFMGCRDKLLDPDSKLVEPLDGCYYFCPTFTKFPGDVFFA